MEHSLQEDLRLVSACRAGDRAAAERFVQRFSGLVYSSVRQTLVSRRIGCSSMDLEDLHNAVFLHLFENKARKLAQYRGRNGSSLATWLRVVTVRRVLNHIRGSHIQTVVHQDAPIPSENLSEQEKEELGPLALLERAERERLVQEAIEHLTPRDRLFMRLYFQDGLGLREVASALGISIQNAYAIKHRAIQRLRSRLRSDP